MNDFNKPFQANETHTSYLLERKADVREVKFELTENQHDDELFSVVRKVHTKCRQSLNPQQREVIL